ncbi:MAG: hypothetical protein HY897_11245 [Deltaproteobacteria bacterium]|nr:hypothetical protein [Deltaproteobacteria bacterium]
MKAEVRRIALRVSLVVAGLLVLVGAGIAVKLLKSGNYLLWATGSNDKAFLDTTWMMSPNEVERATRSPLAVQEDLPQLVPDLARKKRFTAAAQRGTHQLFGVPIDVTYVFFDRLLYAYSLDFRVSDIDKVPEIRNALQSRFGTPGLRQKGSRGRLGLRHKGPEF